VNVLLYTLPKLLLHSSRVSLSSFSFQDERAHSIVFYKLICLQRRSLLRPTRRSPQRLSTMLKIAHTFASLPYFPSMISFLFFYLVFVTFTSSHSTPKTTSWVITTCASCLMTLASLPFLYSYLCAGGQVHLIPLYRHLSEIVCKTFQGYLVCDLAVGTAFYPALIDPFTGWGHHIAYTFIIDFTVRRGWSHIFCLCLSMELPTFLLGLGILYPKLRSDSLFAATFLLTRIALHLALIFTLSLNPYNGTIMPSVLMTSVFPFHAMWFTNCIKGMIRRRRSRKLAMLQSGIPSTQILRLEISCSGLVPNVPTPRHAMNPSMECSSVSGPPIRPLLVRRRCAKEVIREEIRHLRDTSSQLHEEARKAILRLQAKLPARGDVFDSVGLGRSPSRFYSGDTIVRDKMKLEDRAQFGSPRVAQVAVR
jgi:hypothetical protein